MANETRTQTQAESKQVLGERLDVSALDPKTVQLLSALLAAQQQQNLVLMREMVLELRKPSEDEQKKIDAERERQKQRAINAARQGEAVDAMIEAQKASCQHLKPNGDHTWRGQVHSNGWAEIKCQRCLTTFRVKPLPEHMASGLNLDQVKGLTIEHLKAWERQSAQIAKALDESAAIARNAARTATESAPAAVR